MSPTQSRRQTELATRGKSLIRKNAKVENRDLSQHVANIIQQSAITSVTVAAAAAAAALLGWRWNVHNHRRNRRWRIVIRLVEERHGMCRWANNVAWHVSRRWLNVVWNCTMHNRCCGRSHSIAIKIDCFQGRHAAVTQGDTTQRCARNRK